MLKPRGRARAVPALLGATLVLTACGGGDDGDGGGGGGGGGDTSFSMLHAFTGEEDTAGLQAIIDAFQEANPEYTVNAEGSNDFESLARTRINGGDAPDVILHPQPGLLEDFVTAGAAQPLTDIDAAGLQENVVTGLLDAVTFEDQLYAVPMRLSPKSFVWYNKPAFDEAGLAVPETQQELLSLTEQVAGLDSVNAPWCIGIESGDATGWVATDWIEDLVVRGAGPDVYDQWVANEIPFDDPQVIEPLEQFMVPIWTNNDYVFGGTQQITREAFGQSVNGIISGDCMMHRQATFIEGFIAENNPDAEYGTDYDFFYYPSIEGSAAGEQPIMTGGDLAAQYTDNEAASAFIQFLTTPEAGQGWAERGGFLSPFTNFDTSAYPSESATKAGEILSNASAVVFDGSDLMPGEVGASSTDGSFWTEMTAFAGGNQDLPTAMSNVQQLYSSVAEQESS